MLDTKGWVRAGPEIPVETEEGPKKVAELKKDTKIKPGQVIETPNCVLMVWASDRRLRGRGRSARSTRSAVKRFMGWTNSKHQLTDRGFRVLEEEYTPGARIVNLFRMASSVKTLYGFMILTHGNETGIDPHEDSEVGRATYAELSGALSYRLGFAIMWACKSTSGRVLVHNKDRFWGTSESWRGYQFARKGARPCDVLGKPSDP